MTPPSTASLAARPAVTPLLRSARQPTPCAPGNRVRSIPLLARTLACVLTVALVACSTGHAEAPRPAAALEVRVAPVQMDVASETLRLPARALAGESARLYPRVTGFVSERHADLGDTVEQGAVLAVISTPEIDQAVREAQAAVDSAGAALELARVNHQRAVTLTESGAISRELFNERAAGLEVARAALMAAQARLDSMRERQSFQQVRAPFAGVIAARDVERGDRVVGDAAAAAPMFELNALDPLRVLVDVPQRLALRVKAGTRATVFFSELADERFSAEVVRSAQSISDTSGGMRVELRLPNPGQRIPAGMIGQVELELPRTTPTLRVPIAALIGPAGQSQVAVVGAESRVQFRPVQVGRNLGNEVEVLSGLEAGEQVVLSPNALLQDGSPVKTRAGS